MARIITNLVRDATLEQVAAMKAGPAQFAAEKAKLELKIDPEKTRDAIAKMCHSEEFMNYAPHVLKGCAEFLSKNGTYFANVVKDALQEQAHFPPM